MRNMLMVQKDKEITELKNKLSQTLTKVNECKIKDLFHYRVHLFIVVQSES